MIGVPTSTALSKPLVTPEVKVFHPRPNTANMITTNKIKPKKSHPVGITEKLAIKIYTTASIVKGAVKKYLFLSISKIILL
jgi:hypothetical protein